MKLHNMNEVAAMLHTNVGTLRHWRQTRPEGYPIGFKIGKRVVYDESEILDFLERQKAADRVA